MRLGFFTTYSNYWWLPVVRYIWELWRYNGIFLAPRSLCWIFRSSRLTVPLHRATYGDTWVLWWCNRCFQVTGSMGEFDSLTCLLILVPFSTLTSAEMNHRLKLTSLCSISPHKISLHKGQTSKLDVVSTSRLIHTQYVYGMSHKLQWNWVAYAVYVHINTQS
jgi:hypothetical protein